MNQGMNDKLRGGLLCSDPPAHDVLRKVIEAPVKPKELAALRERVTAEAETLVERLVARGSFDVATDLAPHLPVTIVSELVGLPEDGRERMLDWAAATFNCLGPINDRTTGAFPIVAEMVDYALTQCVPGKLSPDGWAQRIWDAAGRGEIDSSICGFLMNDYMGPSLDTTIFATSFAIWLFAKHPDQWDMIRENNALIPQAINEIVRIESPITSFSRYVARDTLIDGVLLPEGSRAIVCYASANRDERKWGDPTAFRILRDDSADHLGFGHGEHNCVGKNLARLEIRALLTALATRVERIELDGPVEYHLNNCLRGIKSCPVKVH
jgi:cytochrome P450